MNIDDASEGCMNKTCGATEGSQGLGDLDAVIERLETLYAEIKVKVLGVCREVMPAQKEEREVKEDRKIEGPFFKSLDCKINILEKVANQIEELLESIVL